MTVVPFAKREFDAAGWQRYEVKRMADVSAEPMALGDISGWETGTTEAGDPQLYLLGPAPGHECIICVSRLGRLYVLEDGQGRILYEHDAIEVLAEQVRDTLRRSKATIVARVAVAWFAVREAFEEKIEPAMAEPMEMLSLIAPQLAALV